MRLVRLLALAFAVGLMPAAALAQTGSTGTVAQQAQGDSLEMDQSSTQKPAFSLQVKSQIVVLDVVVTDKDGKAVNHLTKDDFTVFEDKVPQKVVQFEAAEDAAKEAAPVAIHSTAELDKLAPQAPVSIIVLDEVTTMFEDQAFARYSLKQYLKTQSDTLTQPTMLMAVNLDKIQVLEDYTTSKAAILDALDHHFAGYNWRAVNGSWKGEQFSAAFSSLMAVAQATAGHPGHKNMVWVGRGFPAIEWDTLPADDQEQAQQLIQNCAELLRNSRVTLYAVDPAGISVTPPAEDADGFLTDDPFGGQMDFDSMAEETGGHAFHGRNDVDNLIGTSVRDGQTFYTIAYRPADVTDTAKAFRNITVKVRYPGLKAVTREGYYVQPPAAAPAFDPATGKPSQQLAADLALASQSLLVYDGVPLTIQRDTATPNLFHLQMQASAFPWVDGANGMRNADLVLAVESFDRKGKSLVKSVKKLTVALKPAEAGADNAKVALAVMIGTEAPAARVRFVVRSTANGKLGAENAFLIDKKLLSDASTGREALKTPSNSRKKR